MNPGRAVLFFAVLATALVGIHLSFDLRGGAAGALAARAALTPGADAARRLEIRRAGEPVTAIVQGEDGVWRLTAPFVGLAAHERVLRLLDALAFTPPLSDISDRALLRRGGAREDFGLAEPRVRVTVALPDGDARTVAFGSPIAAGQGVYASVEGLLRVFIAPTNVFAAADLSADGFRRRRLLDLNAASIAALEVRRGAGAATRLARDAAGGWRMTAPREGAVSSARVNAYLEALLATEAEGFAWPTGAVGEPRDASVALLSGYGLDPEGAVSLRLRTASGAEALLAFGKDAGAGRIYALAQGGAAVVTVGAALRDRAFAGAEALADDRLFPLEARDVTRVALTDGAWRCLLSRGANGAWRLDAPVSAPADAPAAAALVGRLLALRPSDRRTEGLQVEVATNLAPATVDRARALGGLRLEDLRSRTVLDVDPKLVRRLVSKAGDAAPTAVVWDPDRSAWNVEAPSRTRGTTDAAAAAAVLKALAPLQAVKVVKLQVSAAELGLYGLATPRHVLAVDRGEAGRRNVLIGDRAPGGGRYATLGAADAVFELSEPDVRVLTAPLVKE